MSTHLAILLLPCQRRAEALIAGYFLTQNELPARTITCLPASPVVPLLALRREEVRENRAAGDAAAFRALECFSHSSIGRRSSSAQLVWPPGKGASLPRRRLWFRIPPRVFFEVDGQLRSFFYRLAYTRCFDDAMQAKGLLRELNPGPLAPEARIMPLDQAAS